MNKIRKNSNVKAKVKKVIEAKVSGMESVRLWDLVMEHAWRWRGEWSDEDNYRSRISNVFRNALNDLGYFSIGGGEYYDVRHGTDAVKVETAMNRLRENVYARIVSLIQKKKKDTGTIAGQYTFNISEDGAVTLVEAV